MKQRRSLMMRLRHFSVALLALTGYALAQPPAPAAANGPGGGQGPGRGVLTPVVIGPSAPVPPEVTIPRPTPEEVAQVNNALRAWVAADKSQANPLLQNFQPTIMLHPARENNGVTYTKTQQRRGPRHEGFAEIARKGDIDVLLHGDSITD